MKKISRESMRTKQPAVTVGIDLGDRFSRYCVVNEEGEVVEEGRIQTTAAGLERHFAKEARQRIAMECGTHSPWVSRLLQDMGHEVWVANARKIRAITARQAKTIATMRRSWRGLRPTIPGLLSPIRHRSPEQRMGLEPAAGTRHAGASANPAGECGAGNG